MTALFRRKPPRLGLCLVVLLAACGGGRLALPAPVFPRRALTEIWPDVGAVTLQDEARLTFRAAGGGGRLLAVLDHRRRIQVLAPLGLEAAHVALPLDAFSTVTRVVARSVAPNGQQRPLAATAVRTEVSPAGQGAAGLQQLTFTVPGAEVGGLIEYRYERVFVEPALMPVWSFGGRLPVVSSELAVAAEPGIHIDYRYGTDAGVQDRPPARRVGDDGLDQLVFLEKDLPAYYPEPLMPASGHFGPWVAVATRGVHGRTVGSGDRWEGAAAPMWPMLEAVGGKALSGRLSARYHQVQAKLRPLNLDGLGLLAPLAARELWRGAPACSRDAAALLWQALGGRAGDATPALVPGPGAPAPIADFPGLYPFVRAAVVVRPPPEVFAERRCGGEVWQQDPLCDAVAGEPLLLDPLCTTCGFGVLPLGMSPERVLVLEPAGAHWVRRPPEPPHHHVLHARVQLEMDVTGHLLGRAELEARGGVAAAARAAAVRSAPAGGARAALLALVGLGGPAGLGEPALRAETALDDGLALTGTAAVQAERVDFEHYRLAPAALVGAAIPEAWLQARRWPAVLDAPRWLESVVEVKLPVGYRATLPEPTRLANEVAEYAAGFSQRGRALRYARRMVVKVAVVERPALEVFYGFADQVRTLEAEGIVVQAAN